METMTFDIIIRSSEITNYEQAKEAFDSLAGEVCDVEFDYDFDYEFKGEFENGYLFKVYVDTMYDDEAYEVMSDKFERDVPSNIEIDY